MGEREVDLVDCGSVMVGGEVGGAAGVTAGCRVVWRKLHAALVRYGGAAAETDLPPPPHPGGERRQWESVSPPQSFRTLLFLTACLFVSSVASSPSLSCRQKFEIKSKGDLEKILRILNINP